MSTLLHQLASDVDNHKPGLYPGPVLDEGPFPPHWLFYPPFQPISTVLWLTDKKRKQFADRGVFSREQILELIPPKDNADPNSTAESMVYPNRFLNQYNLTLDQACDPLEFHILPKSTPKVVASSVTSLPIILSSSTPSSPNGDLLDPELEAFLTSVHPQVFLHKNSEILAGHFFFQDAACEREYLRIRHFLSRAATYRKRTPLTMSDGRVDTHPVQTDLVVIDEIDNILPLLDRLETSQMLQALTSQLDHTHSYKSIKEVDNDMQKAKPTTPALLPVAEPNTGGSVAMGSSAQLVAKKWRHALASPVEKGEESTKKGSVHVSIRQKTQGDNINDNIKDNIEDGKDDSFESDTEEDKIVESNVCKDVNMTTQTLSFTPPVTPPFCLLRVSHSASFEHFMRHKSTEISVDLHGLSHALFPLDTPPSVTVMIKSLSACGPRGSHGMVVAEFPRDAELLQRILPEGLYFAQEYINHDALIYKAYTVFPTVQVKPASSLPNVGTSASSFDGLYPGHPWFFSSSSMSVSLLTEADAGTGNSYDMISFYPMDYVEHIIRSYCPEVVYALSSITRENIDKEDGNNTPSVPQAVAAFSGSRKLLSTLSDDIYHLNYGRFYIRPSLVGSSDACAEKRSAFRWFPTAHTSKLYEAECLEKTRKVALKSCENPPADEKEAMKKTSQVSVFEFKTAERKRAKASAKSDPNYIRNQLVSAYAALYPHIHEKIDRNENDDDKEQDTPNSPQRLESSLCSSTVQPSISHFCSQASSLLHRLFGLTLFGFDVIASSSAFHIVDVNYFPSYDGFPHFPAALGDLILREVNATWAAQSLCRVCDNLCADIGQELFLNPSLDPMEDGDLHGESESVSEPEADVEKSDTDMEVDVGEENNTAEDDGENEGEDDGEERIRAKDQRRITSTQRRTIQSRPGFHSRVSSNAFSTYSSRCGVKSTCSPIIPPMSVPMSIPMSENRRPLRSSGSSGFLATALQGSSTPEYSTMVTKQMAPSSLSLAPRNETKNGMITDSRKGNSISSIADLGLRTSSSSNSLSSLANPSSESTVNNREKFTSYKKRSTSGTIPTTILNSRFVSSPIIPFQGQGQSQGQEQGQGQGRGQREGKEQRQKPIEEQEQRHGHFSCYAQAYPVHSVSSGQNDQFTQGYQISTEVSYDDSQLSSTTLSQSRSRPFSRGPSRSKTTRGLFTTPSSSEDDDMVEKEELDTSQGLDVLPFPDQTLSQPQAQPQPQPQLQSQTQTQNKYSLSTSGIYSSRILSPSTETKRQNGNVTSRRMGRVSSYSSLHTFSPATSQSLLLQTILSPPSNNVSDTEDASNLQTLQSKSNTYSSPFGFSKVSQTSSRHGNEIGNNMVVSSVSFPPLASSSVSITSNPVQRESRRGFQCPEKVERKEANPFLLRSPEIRRSPRLKISTLLLDTFVGFVPEAKLTPFSTRKAQRARETEKSRPRRKKNSKTTSAAAMRNTNDILTMSVSTHGGAPFTAFSDPDDLISSDRETGSSSTLVSASDGTGDGGVGPNSSDFSGFSHDSDASDLSHTSRTSRASYASFTSHTSRLSNTSNVSNASINSRGSVSSRLSKLSSSSHASPSVSSATSASSTPSTSIGPMTLIPASLASRTASIICGLPPEIYIVGYGSLLSRISALTTCPNLAHFSPALIRGMDRVFSLVSVSILRARNVEASQRALNTPPEIWWTDDWDPSTVASVSVRKNKEYALYNSTDISSSQSSQSSQSSSFSYREVEGEAVCGSNDCKSPSSRAPLSLGGKTHRSLNVAKTQAYGAAVAKAYDDWDIPLPTFSSPMGNSTASSDPHAMDESLSVRAKQLAPHSTPPALMCVFSIKREDFVGYLNREQRYDFTTVKAKVLQPDAMRPVKTELDTLAIPSEVPTRTGTENVEIGDSSKTISLPSKALTKNTVTAIVCMDSTDGVYRERICSAWQYYSAVGQYFAGLLWGQTAVKPGRRYLQFCLRAAYELAGEYGYWNFVHSTRLINGEPLMEYILHFPHFFSLPAVRAVDFASI